MREVIAYRNVFERKDTKSFEFKDFIMSPEVIFEHFELHNAGEELERIKNIAIKSERNEAKRTFIPAVDLSASGILSIDIDNISDDEVKREKIIERLSKLDTCHVLMDSVSGNLVAFFKYECSTREFPFLYYKIYLELTLLLSINIDFLPEIGRLRYVSNGVIHHYNEESEELTEIMDCEVLPYINTQVGKDKARRTIYGSN